MAESLSSSYDTANWGFYCLARGGYVYPRGNPYRAPIVRSVYRSIGNCLCKWSGVSSGSRDYDHGIWSAVYKEK